MDAEIIEPKPFVKWAGGKRSILKELLKRMPPSINNYYEPFVGGGALFFALYNRVQHSYLSDLNGDLVLSYNSIKKEPQKLIALLKKHAQNHNKDYYLHLRAQHALEDPVANSARFIYLMKTCFNGLYRVNKKNEFNTPMGDYKTPLICDSKNILAVHKALQKTTIECHDFTKINPQKGDFVYFDPPYHPIKADSFTRYVRTGFDYSDQKRLRDFALELSKRGVHIMLSNSDSDFIVNLYKENFYIEKIPAPRVINSKGEGRQAVLETLIRNFL